MKAFKGAIFGLIPTLILWAVIVWVVMTGVTALEKVLLAGAQ